jgi:tetratricopeptide (TPR) repeat protein
VAGENRFARERAVPKFREAFRAYGLTAGEGEPKVAAERIRQRPAAVREAIVAALDEWDDLAGNPKYKISEPHREWLRAVLEAAEPDDAWSRKVRAARRETDAAKRQAALEALAKSATVAELPARVLTRWAYVLRPAQAAELRRRAQRQYPADFWVNHNLGVVLPEGTPPEMEEAVRFLTAAVALRPESPGAHNNLGLALMHKGQLDEAIASYKKDIALDPKNAAAHYILGFALAEKGQLDEAIASFKKAIALDPKNAGAYAVLGIALYQKGQLDDSIARHKKAIALDPKNAIAHFDLGAALYRKGQVDEALACYKNAMAIASSRKATVGLGDFTLFIRVAALQDWFGQDKELAETCRRGLAAAQNTTVAREANVVAKACCVLPSTDQARLEAALVLAHKAVQLDKDSGGQTWSQMALGMAEYRSGHFAAADAALLTAEKNAKNNPHVAGTSAFYRAMTLFRQGKEDEARKLASAAAAKMKPLPKDEKDALVGDANADDLILWLAYKEAKALIGFDAAPPPDKKK